MSNLIPFPESEDLLGRKTYAAAVGHDYLDASRSGVWDCKLKTTAPLCLKSYFEQIAGRERIALPASSIRGMIRNMAEVLGAGCGLFHGEKPSGIVRKCPDTIGCISCRLFGTTNWQGKVQFTDTEPAPVKWIRLHLPAENRDGLPGGSGWCVFPAIGLRAKSATDQETAATRCIDQGAEFPFQVRYTNLEDDELAVLLFALSLSRPPETALCHMLGYAKGLGLGRCAIEVIKAPAIPAVIEKWLSRPAFRDLCAMRAVTV